MRGTQAKKVLHGASTLPETDLFAYCLKIEDNKARFLLAESQGALPERDTGNKGVGQAGVDGSPFHLYHIFSTLQINYCRYFAYSSIGEIQLRNSLNNAKE
jgi:hypothetical protein